MMNAANSNAVGGDFDTCLGAFVAQEQARFDAHHARSTPSIARVVVTVERLRRFVRVAKGSSGDLSRSVHCFVEIATGQVYRSESWKAAGRPVAVNIYDVQAPVVACVMPTF